MSVEQPQSPPWFVLVEEFSGHGEGSREVVRPIKEAASWEEAQATAEQTAWTHSPQNPMRERNRSVFRCPDGSWLVNVHGRTSSFHLRVIVAQWYGDRRGR